LQLDSTVYKSKKTRRKKTGQTGKKPTQYGQTGKNPAQKYSNRLTRFIPGNAHVEGLSN
jgi:hypothetical protein